MTPRGRWGRWRRLGVRKEGGCGLMGWERRGAREEGGGGGGGGRGGGQEGLKKVS